MPGDNIYPDLSNSQFDIQYARLMGLPSDLRATLGVIEELPSSVFPGNPPVFETPSDDDTGQFRFAVAAEDNIAAQHRAFDLAGAYKFEITQLGNVQFIVDPTNGLYQLGAVPVVGSDSVLSYTYLEIDDTTRKIKLQAAEGIMLPGYGVGAHLVSPVYSLGVDAGGNLIEFLATPGGSDDWQDTLINGSTLTQDNTIAGGGFTFAFTNGRFTIAKGADVASTNDLTVGGGGNTFRITGTTQINALATANWQDGSDVFLVFDSALTVKHGTAGGAGTAQMLLAGSEDLITDANTILHLKKTSSTTWEEIGRKQSTIIGNVRLNQIKAANGTNTINNADYTQEWQWNTLSGSGIKLSSTSTAAAGNAQKLLSVIKSGANVNSSQITYSIYAENNNTGTSAVNYAIYGQVPTGGSNTGVRGEAAGNATGVHGGSSSGLGVLGVSSSNQGVNGRSTSSYGVFGQSNSGQGGGFQVFHSTTNTIVDVVNIIRMSSGVAGNGIGGKVVFINETSDGNGYEAAGIAATWIDTTLTSRMGSLRNFVTSNATILERYSIFGNYTTLTESTATAFLRINIPSGTVSGGEILITVEANDATDFQARTLRFIWAAVNKAGTTTITISTAEETAAVSSGTLTVAITAVDAGSGNVDFKADAASSLTQTVLRCQCQLLKNFGTGAVTPQ